MSTAVELSEAECVTVLQVALNSQDVKLLNYRLVSNTPDGFNGLYYTLVINYRYRNEVKDLSCFLKSIPKNDRHLYYLNGTKLVDKEYEIYEKFIPAFKQYINFDLAIPECYLIREVAGDPFQNIMVFEDLKEKGFIMRNPREAMGISECKLVMRALAKWHASSVIFETRGQSTVLEQCQYPQEVLWVTDPNHPAFPWVQSSIDTITELAVKLETLAPRLASSEARAKHAQVWADAIQQTKPSEKFQNVICHGDIWSNNMMFKYQDNVCCDVRIVDFQTYRYTPPMLDVLMFLHLNTTRSFREQHRDELISLYAEVFRVAVEESGCVLPPELSLGGLKEQQKEFTLFALVAAAGYVPMGQLPPETRIKRVNLEHTEGQRDFDVLYDFLNSRSEQVWRGMQIDCAFAQRITDAFDELLTYIGL